MLFLTFKSSVNTCLGTLQGTNSIAYHHTALTVLVHGCILIIVGWYYLQDSRVV